MIIHTKREDNRKNGQGKITSATRMKTGMEGRMGRRKRIATSKEEIINKKG